MRYVFHGSMSDLMVDLDRSRMIHSRFINSEDWLRFLSVIAKRLGIEKVFYVDPVIMIHDENDPDVLEGIQKNPRLAGTIRLVSGRLFACLIVPRPISVVAH
jgi:hypothetical protein